MMCLWTMKKVRLEDAHTSQMITAVVADVEIIVKLQWTIWMAVLALCYKLLQLNSLSTIYRISKQLISNGKSETLIADLKGTVQPFYL